MASVTQRIRQIKQPYGGYIPASSLKVIPFPDAEIVDLDIENVHSSLVGLAVDYLTRLVLTGKAKKSFDISLLGAANLGWGSYIYARILIHKIQSEYSATHKITKDIVINACKLSGYDVVYRSGRRGYKPVRTINPNSQTIRNIKHMVERTVRFLDSQSGDGIRIGYCFDCKGAKYIHSGDCDYITEANLIDLKVSIKPPTSKYTLQLLVYWIMGMMRDAKVFKSIEYLVIFNPRLNKAYSYQIRDINYELVKKVAKKVIGYKK